MSSKSEFWSSVRATLVAVSAATVFGIGLGFCKGWKSSLEFFSGYLVEQSLSIDNLFVFVMLFEYFHVPPEYQQRVLTWGVGGAIVMRGLMIVAGVAAVKKFKWMTLLFAGILFLSSMKLLLETSGDDDEVHCDNFVVRFSRSLVGATSEYDGDRFFTDGREDSDDDDLVDPEAPGQTMNSFHGDEKKKKNSGFSFFSSRRKKRRRRVATPLFLTLVCVELSDVVFAVDSIPAVLGISTDPFVVYSSNIFAIAGLRALYTLVARAVDSMVYLKPAVCLVLLFISFKMILEYFDYHLSTLTSLSVVIFLLAGGALLSVLHQPKQKKHDDIKNDRETNSHAHNYHNGPLHRRAASIDNNKKSYNTQQLEPTDFYSQDLSKALV